MSSEEEKKVSAQEETEETKGKNDSPLETKLKKYNAAFDEIKRGISNNTLIDTKLTNALKTIEKNNIFEGVRYVKINQEKPNEYMHFQQIEVFDTTNTNIALKNSTVTASSIFNEKIKNENIIDGNSDINSKWPNCNHTKNGAKEWIELDLLKNCDLLRVVITNINQNDKLFRAKTCTLELLNENRASMAKFTLKAFWKQTFGYLIGENGKSIFHEFATSDYSFADNIWDKMKPGSMKFATDLQLSYDVNGHTPLLAALCNPNIKSAPYINHFINQASIKIDVLNMTKGQKENVTPLHVAHKYKHGMTTINAMKTLRKDMENMPDHSGRKPFQCRPELFGDLSRIQRHTALKDIEFALALALKDDKNALKKKLSHDKADEVRRKHGGAAVAKRKDALVKAVKDGNLDDCKILIEDGEDINWNAASQDMNTPLTRAAASGHLEICKFLMSKPDIDINKGGYYNRSPLLMSSWNGHESIVELLLGHPDIGPSLTRAGSGGNTPLGKAKNGGIKMLIQNKIDAKATVGKSFIYKNFRSPGNMPLHSAVSAGCPLKVLRRLIGSSAEDKEEITTAKNRDNDLPIHLLLERQTKYIMDMKIGTGKGNYITCTDGTDAPSLTNDINSLKNNIEIVPASMASAEVTQSSTGDAAAEIKKKYGTDALCKAVKENAIEDVKKLIEAGEDINFKAPTQDLNTPLARAAASGHIEICKYLISQSFCDVNLGGYNNRSPLLMCTWNGYKDIVELVCNFSFSNFLFL